MSFLNDFYKIVIIIYNLYHYMTIIWCYFFISLSFILIIYKENNNSCFLRNIKRFFEKKEFNFQKINLFFIISNSFLNKTNNNTSDAPVSKGKQEANNLNLNKSEELPVIDSLNDIDINLSSRKLENNNLNLKKNQDLSLIKSSNDNQKNISNGENNCCNKIIILIKIIVIILSFLALIYLFLNYPGKISKMQIFILFLIDLFIIIISFWINFPFILMFSKNNTNFYKDQIYLIISILICTFIKIIVLFLFYTVVTTKDIEELHESKFNNITLNSTLFNKSTHIFHTFCDSKIYNIPIHLYLPFINDAYYYNYKSNFTSFNYKNYRRLFFDDNYTIVKIKNLTDETNRKSVKMIQYNIKKKIKR